MDFLLSFRHILYHPFSPASSISRRANLKDSRLDPPKNNMAAKLCDITGSGKRGSLVLTTPSSMLTLLLLHFIHAQCTHCDSPSCVSPDGEYIGDRQNAPGPRFTAAKDSNYDIFGCAFHWLKQITPARRGFQQSLDLMRFHDC